MTAYKCDICGTFYNKQEWLDMAPEKRVKDARGAHTPARLGDSQHYFDVCPTCTKLLQATMDARRQEGQNHED